MEYKVVDVSEYNGNINWQKVKEDGISAAILRVSKRYTADPYFEKNYTGAKAAGLKVGVYKYSYDLSTSESAATARGVLATLNDRELDFPIFLDLEWKTQKALGSAKVAAIAKSFQEVIAKSKYKPAIYCNVDWYNFLDKDILDYDYWIAHYAGDGSFKESNRPSYGVGWQWTSKGRVNGISGDVDMNIFYTDYSDIKENIEMRASEKRQTVADKYSIILGRNIYSQSLRDYCYRAYNGKYYSDCSSSISYAYKEAGFGFGILNTAGMYNSTKWKFVDVGISKGIPTDVNKLRVGDILLFAGTDSSRPKCIGHVEMVYKIDGNTVTLCGHGSGNPSLKNMNTYCSQRYNSKTSTAIGNKGLVCVKRYISDDRNYLMYGDTGEDVKRFQEDLNKLGYDCGVADGIWGKKTDIATEKFQKDNGLEPDVKAGVQTLAKVKELLAAQNKPRWIKQSGKWWYRHADGTYTKNGWEFINSKWYYFDAEGWMKSGWLKWNNKWYYLGGADDGSMKTGWYLVGNTWYFSNTDGSMVESDWIKHTDSNWYYLTASGAMATNAYIKSKPKSLYYWVDKNGVYDDTCDTETPDLKKYKLVI